MAASIEKTMKKILATLITLGLVAQTVPAKTAKPLKVHLAAGGGYVAIIR